MIRRRPHLFLALLLAAGLAAVSEPAGAVPIQATRLEDGVILWTPKDPPAGKSLFFKAFEDLAKVVLPAQAELPFDRSVAFLVGVSNYKSLKPLPFVKNDLQDMKDYLLQEGGFDRVYVAADEVVTNDLIESYMMNRFPAELGPRDRLLFYYAGHGSDAQGRTGYLLFANARRGDFAHQVLAVSRVLEWGKVNDAAHMLFLLDTCSSGLAFTARGVSGDDERRLVQTLSGRGSRTVVTAGTADEETFEVTAGGRGNGVFTRALLAALEQGKSQRNAPAFLTIDQVVADLQVSVAKFAAENRKSLNPKLWTFDDDQYRGSFVFLNPAVKSAPVTESHLAQIRAVRGEAAPEKPSEAELAAREKEADRLQKELQAWLEGQKQADSGSPPSQNTGARPAAPSPTTFQGMPMKLVGLGKSGKRMYGTITDETGAVLPGVTVTLSGLVAPVVTVTNATGSFSLLVNALGTCTLTAELEGFATIETKLRVSGSSVQVLGAGRP